jgi:hypothetical protein
MIKLQIQPYLDNARFYWEQNIPPSPDSYTEDEWDRDFVNWLYPIYRCRIKVRKKDGFGRWFEFDSKEDMLMFMLRWS